MFELAIRLTTVGAMVALALWKGSPEPMVGVKIGAMAATLAVCAMILRRRDLMNHGLAAAIAVLESGCLVAYLAASGRLDQFGFAALVPCAYAAARYGANSTAMTPIVVCAMIAASNVVTRQQPSAALLLQSALMLGLGLLLGQNFVPDLPVPDRSEEPAVTVATAAKLASAPLPQNYLILRENFRKLRDYCQQLEARSLRDRIASALYEAAFGTGDRMLGRLASRLRELAQCEGLTIHALAQIGDVMVLKAAAGTIAPTWTTAQFDLTNAASDMQIRHRIEQTLASHRMEGDATVRTLIIKRDGRAIGLVSASDARPDRLERALQRLEKALPILAQLIDDDLQREQAVRKAEECEILYAIASITRGAETMTSLAQRVVRESWGLFTIDHLALSMADGDRMLMLAHQGARHELLTSMNFGGVEGLTGWIAAGCPEVYAFDVETDPRIPRREALRARVGSFALIPLRGAQDEVAFLTASTHRAGGIDLREIATLRAIGAELGHALWRLGAPSDAMAGGLMGPREFQEMLRTTQDGWLIHASPLHRERIVQDFGAHAFEHASRTFARRLQAQLAPGDALCRKDEGDYLILLKSTDEAGTRAWANQATALASTVALTTPDGGLRLPFGIQTKVARHSLSLVNAS